MSATGSSAATHIAQVAVETSLMHLDKLFDYAIPAELSTSVRVGSRVRVRFAGSLVNGWVLGLAQSSAHVGKVLPIQRVIGDVPPLTSVTSALVRAIADRYAGTFTDVLRSAIPARHAATETAFLSDNPACAGQYADDIYDRSTAHAGDSADHSESSPRRVAWLVPPGTDHWRAVAAAVVEAASRGSVIVVLPDATDVSALRSELAALLPDEQIAVLTADSGPSRRWRAFLSARLGSVRIVIGTRSAVFVPIPKLRMLLLWDDADDSHREQHAPYWHARDVAVLRSGLERCDLVLAGRSLSVEAAALVARRWLSVEQSDRATRGERWPAVRASMDGSEASIREAANSARIPPLAMAALREGLRHGSVLLSVAARGYVPVLACSSCRQIARCPVCAGHVHTSTAGSAAGCSRCGWNQWRVCPHCGSSGLRAVRVGDERTADEIGRAFPQVPVVVSNADRRVTAIPRKASIVVATHGCEPFAGEPYAAVVLLDVATVINRPLLNAEADALRRFVHAIALAGPGTPAVVVADNSLPIVQALVRGDVAGWATRELDQREATHLPPATVMIGVSGSVVAVHDFIDDVALPQPFSVFGPVPYGKPDADKVPTVRALIVVPRSAGKTTMTRVCEVLRIRSARKAPQVRVVVDPDDV